MTVFVSTGAFESPNLSTIFSESRKAGLARIELSANVELDDGWQEQLSDQHDSFDLLVHNYFPPPPTPFVLNLAATDPEVAIQSRTHCTRAIDLCVRIGAPFYSVHAGFALNLTPDLLGNPRAQAQLSDEARIPRQIAYDVFVESVREVNRYAKRRGVELLIENNVVSPFQASPGEEPPLLLASPGEMRMFLEDIGDPNVGVLLDVAHLNVSARALGFDRAEAIQEVEPHIRAFHVSENDGITDSNCPVRRSSWFMDHLKRIPDAPIVVEVYGLGPEGLRRQRNLIEQAL